MDSNFFVVFAVHEPRILKFFMVVYISLLVNCVKDRQ